jgi:hypothetical protein
MARKVNNNFFTYRQSAGSPFGRSPGLTPYGPIIYQWESFCTWCCRMHETGRGKKLAAQKLNY